MKRDAICFSDHVVIIAEDKGEDLKRKRSRKTRTSNTIQVIHRLFWKFICPKFLWRNDQIWIWKVRILCIIDEKVMKNCLVP